MNQNVFCKNCHRIPDQCRCNTAPRELSDEEIFSIYKDAFGWEITNPKDNWVLLAREIERRIKCK